MVGTITDMTSNSGDEPRDPFAPKPEGEQSPYGSTGWGSDPDQTGPVTPQHDPAAAPPPYGQSGDAPQGPPPYAPQYGQSGGDQGGYGQQDPQSSPWQQPAGRPEQGQSSSGATPPPYAPQYGEQPQWVQDQYAQQGQQPMYGGAYGFPTPPSHPQATTSMVLGLIGLIGGIFCLLPLIASPFAWFQGRRVIAEIDASGGQLGGRGNAQVGQITGIIGTIFLILVIVGIGLFIMLAVFAASGSSSGF